ncbi:SDR family NAD(P)-dependent oxidoreductase [Microbacterium gorillae]|uniref:SDR family NAD(P)-dependent oxidoreductase n=1 Tax=Microbacterium gorillae TaxID=1231063 RepID=UPI000AD77423|nr:SDR family NAD(P)-dependent oxidoreductase [Microbacterium gorillae]
MGKLDDRVALITGAGRGIGRALALKLAGEGARIVANDLAPGDLDVLIADVEALGGSAVGVAGDIVDPTFGDRFVRAAVDAFGGVDIIVNNAGYTWDAVLQKTTDEQWQAMADVHVTAPFRILRAAQPVISRAAKAERAANGVARCRKVVNITSRAGTVGHAGQINYSTAKAGVIGLTRSLAQEWGRYNVTVNAVAFGVIQTRLTAPPEENEPIAVGDHAVSVGVDARLIAEAERLAPLGRLGTVEDAAGAVYLLTLPESDFITGEILTCSGGY